MKIKKYTSFLKESITEESAKKIIEERKQFVEMVSELEGKEFDLPNFFSDFCKKDNDPDSDFQKIQQHFDKRGFTLERIKSLFSKEMDRSLGQNLADIYLESLDSINGVVDVYLYKLFEKLVMDKNIIQLGGDSWSDWRITEDEAFIRYTYGYHTTKYGQLMIEQSGMTEEEFAEDATEYLQEYIDENLSSIISESFRNKFKVFLSDYVNRNDFDQFKIEDWTIVESDRYILDIAGICDWLNNLPMKDNKPLGSKYKMDPEDIVSEFTKRMDILKLDIVFTGYDFVIYSKFNENL
jgi:hypothetical protein